VQADVPGDMCGADLLRPDGGHPEPGGQRDWNQSLLDQLRVGPRGLQRARDPGEHQLGQQEDKEDDQHFVVEPSGSGLHEHHVRTWYFLIAIHNESRIDLGVLSREHEFADSATDHGSNCF